MSEIPLEIRDHVARFTINRPAAMNALSSASWHEMLELVRAALPPVAGSASRRRRIW